MDNKMLVWKLSRGYAKIELAHNRPEQVMNAALENGISLHNIERVDKKTFRAIIRYTDLDAMRELCDEMRCAVNVLERGGINCVIASALSRPALIVSVMAALMALFALSKRVLVVKVSAWDTSIEKKAEAFLIENGLRIGMLKSKAMNMGLDEKLKLIDDRVGDTSVGTDGVVFYADIAFREQHEREDEQPSSIYADKDCVILKIAALDGRAVVGVGDAVKKDQLLVDGDITPEQGTERVLVSARAEITAQTAYRFSVNIDANSVEKTRSGNKKECGMISVFGRLLNVKTEYADFETDTKSSVPLDFSPLPICVKKGCIYELKLEKTQMDKDEMIKKAIEEGGIKLKSTVPETASIISKSTDFIWNADGSLTAVFNIQTIEKIGYTRSI